MPFFMMSRYQTFISFNMINHLLRLIEFHIEIVAVGMRNQISTVGRAILQCLKEPLSIIEVLWHAASDGLGEPTGEQ